MLKKIRTILVSVILIVTATVTTSALELKLREVKLTDDGMVTVYKTSAKTVESFLKKEGIEIEEYDNLNVSLDSEIQNRKQLEIEIERKTEVKVVIDDKSSKMIVPSTSKISNVINMIDKGTNVSYIYNGNESDNISPNMEIKLKSKKEETYSTLENIPYNTIYEETENLDEGTEEVKVEGLAGTKEVVTKVVFVGGNEESREVISEKLVVEPVAQVIEKGTGRIIKTENGTLRVQREMVMEATAYTAGYESTGKREGDPYYGITASGMKVRPGVVAVDPKVIPLGTKLYVEGYGEAIAADTGGAIKGNKIDLYYENLSDAYKFGRRNLTVYVLK